MEHKICADNCPNDFRERMVSVNFWKYIKCVDMDNLFAEMFKTIWTTLIWTIFI